MIEDHLDVSFASGRAGGCDGLLVGFQREAGAHECLQAHFGGDAECECEAARFVSFVLFDAVGVAAGELDLFVPEGGEVQCAFCAWHPDERDVAARARKTERVLYRAWCADALEDFASSAGTTGLPSSGLYASVPSISGR